MFIFLLSHKWVISLLIYLNILADTEIGEEFWLSDEVSSEERYSWEGLSYLWALEGHLFLLGFVEDSKDLLDFASNFKTDFFHLIEGVVRLL